ncbi:TPA: PEGA domain-containing protein [Candidatus Poribacteria bacterium]|nr:PEGA domain-containing protein [Candidatus Poribacteria bacterium]
MQTQSPPPEKRGIPTIFVLVPLVIVALALFLLALSWLIPRMGFKSIESREDISEKPLPKRKASRVNLYIQSNVGGADVYVNGEKQATGTRSSDLKASIFGLRPGTYEIQLKKEDYQDATRTVKLTGDKAVETIIIELEPLENNP